ncbi:transcription factor SPEECHLESS [Prunus yedoensis var. nudiflora]|uniref:Transcription factor SPEECHLESS n=1 Tax=Prunus yedoensis var. nudiflora TaxID=2094558 RepID=A0A314YDL0_PRUYE|nr:transcription factor SPEECHLESS [Prunus yedoensis var. nudiflora]
MAMDDHDRPSSDFFQEHEHILESLDDGFGFGGAMEFPPPPVTVALDDEQPPRPFVFSSSSADQTELDETNSPPKTKRLKLSASPASGGTATTFSDEDGQQTRMSHITVERNRRKQMNDHLSVLRSLMPCFYVKRGDQASIIGGVVDYINELQQVLQSLEAKKQRKAYSEVLSSPRLASSPRPPGPSPPVLSPRKPPLSPRLSLPPISPRTPQPTSPYKPSSARALQQPPPQLPASANIISNYLISSPNMPTSSSLELPSPSSSTTSSHVNNNNNNIDNLNELFANSKSAVAQVEVKFSGPNVLLKRCRLQYQDRLSESFLLSKNCRLKFLTSASPPLTKP